MKNPEINDLWNRFKGGDNLALSLIYSYYVHQLYSYGLKIHGDEFLVKDCIQEVFIKLIDNRKRLMITDNISLYLFKSLRNKLLDELRSKNRRADIVHSIAENNPVYEISAEQSTVLSEEEDFRTITMNKALSKLSDYQKEAIYLKYSQGLEYERMAELLGIDTASARTLIYRALKKVKEAINNKTQLLLFFFRSRSIW
jgi:RNA polymerase sigma factor (sigma-70 family)